MGRRLLAPEVVQTSAMDCGPASLQCLLDGYGIPVSYGRLREACQIDLDGTSIDTVEQVACELGLEAEQIMLPPDHLLLPGAQALPAVVVVRRPNGATHFVLCWRRHGQFVQVMDPARGRRWLPGARFLEELYEHVLPVSIGMWCEWAGSPEFGEALRDRLGLLGIPRETAARLLSFGPAEPAWRPPAALDAAIRMIHRVVRAGGLNRGREAGRVLEHLYEASLAAPEPGPIPAAYWSIHPTRSSPDKEKPLLFRGAVLVRVRGRRRVSTDRSGDDRGTGALSRELAAAVSEPPARPVAELLRLVGHQGSWLPLALGGAIALAAGGTVVEALLFLGLFDLPERLVVGAHRLGALGALLAFVFVLLVLDASILAGALRLGRHLETRLRISFLRKIPLLGDRYFSSRPKSDMAERGHNVHRLRGVPETGEWLARSSLELGFTVAAIAWLDPAAAAGAALAALTAICIPLASLPLLQEWDLRVRTHVGALSQVYLDALLGIVPLRSHGAESAIRSEHESLLADWARARLRLQQALALAEALMSAVIVGLLAWLVLGQRLEASASLVLLVFWGLNLLTLGHSVTLLLGQQYPQYRSLILRLLEPLRSQTNGDESGAGGVQDRSPPAVSGLPQGTEIEFRGVSVHIGGHTVLHDIDLRIPSGGQVVIVGPSGAGKSSLVGLLLGWHRAAAGHVLVDGSELSAAGLEKLRGHTAWVDPAVQLWNRSLLDNLTYGSSRSAASDVGAVIERANLVDIAERLSEGLQTPLGEGGALVSGGEGQRVRLGRAMLRHPVRLVILDEPFSGLDRQQQSQLLARVRALWPQATLLYVTHDVGEIDSFDRVLVMEGGRIAEDGPPGLLRERPGPRMSRLLDAHRAVRAKLSSPVGWRRWCLADGRLSEQEPMEAHDR